MWNDITSVTAMTDAAANDFLRDIIPPYYIHNDISFVSTLRALVYPRAISKDSDFYLCLSFQNEGELTNTPAVYLPDSNCNTLTICDFRSISDDFNSVEAENDLKDRFPSWIPQVQVGKYFRKSFPVVCMIDPEHKRTVLLVHRLTPKKLHYLQCAIPAYLPWYFDPKDGYSDEEMALLESLRKDTPDEYLRILEEIASRFSFKEEWMKRKLAGYDTSGLERKIQYEDSQILDLNAEIENLYIQIQGKKALKQQHEAASIGYRAMRDSQNEGDSEILKLFQRSNALELIDVSGDNIWFYVKDYLRFWGARVGDEELDKYLNNPRGFFYSHAQQSMEDLKPLWEEVFVNQTIKIKMATKVYLRPNCVGNEREDYVPGYIFNPHFHYHNCWGDNRDSVVRFLDKGDFVGAICACITASGSINLNEISMTAEPFIRDLTRSKEKCFELPTGECVDINEAIKRIKEGTI